MPSPLIGPRCGKFSSTVSFDVPRIWPCEGTAKAFAFESDKKGKGAVFTCADELRAGALGRARAALERTDAEIAFGLEGGATLDGERAWLTGHVIALARDGRLGEAAWGRMLLPPAATSRLIAGEELGDVIDDLFGRKESKRQTGAIGLLTENVVTRTDAFADLVAMACAPFLHPELYQPGPNRRIRTI